MLIILLCVCHFFAKTLSSDDFYCSPGLCPKGTTHIACRNDGSFAELCPSNARMISLEPFEERILYLHNSRRNLIASGDLPGYKPAHRMATMQWDDELAKMAALNVKQCEMCHDKCRNTRNFTKSGQNLARITYNGAESRKSNSDLVDNRVTAWWNEYQDCNMSMIEKYPVDYDGPDIGHFTVFVRDKNIRVGCAAIRYTNENRHTFLIACNYATTNFYNAASYIAGPPGKGCKTGPNPNYTSLCSKKEVYTGLN